MKPGKRYLSLLLPIMLIVLTTCSNPLTQSATSGAALDTAPPVNLPAGMGALTVNLWAEGQMRTAIPTFNFAKYKVVFTCTSDSSLSAPQIEDAAASHTVYLLPGDWTVGVSAYASADVLAAQGSVSVTVTAGAAASVTVQLGFPADVDGTLTYTMTFPADTYSTTKLRVTKMVDASAAHSLDTFTSGSPTHSMAGSPSLAAGAYMLTVELTNTTQGHTAYWQTAVHIYGGHTTTVTHTFAAADFVAYVPVIGAITLTQNATPGTLAVKVYPSDIDLNPLTTIIDPAPFALQSGIGSKTYNYLLFIPASEPAPYLRLVANGVNTSAAQAISGFPGTTGAITTNFTRTFYAIDTTTNKTGNGTVTAKIGGTGGTTVTGAFEGPEITLVAAPDTNNILSGEMSILGISLGLTGNIRTFTMPAADAAVTAVFKRQYTVTFNNQGHGPMTTDQTITDGEKAASPGNLSDMGYTFGGWYKEAACTDAWNFAADTVAGNTTIWAKWTANEYTISFDANGGSGTPYAQAMTYDTAAYLGPNLYTRTGYTFAGWATTAGGTAVYTDSQSVNNLSAVNGATVNLYAKWTVITYDITYTFTGGTNSLSNPATYTFESTAITLQPPTRSDGVYEFDGWYTDSGFTTAAAVPAIPAGSTGNKVFYGRWKTEGGISITQPPGSSGRSITADVPTTINWSNGSVTFSINDTTGISIPDISWQVNGNTKASESITVKPNEAPYDYGLRTGTYKITVYFTLGGVRYSEETTLTVNAG